MSLPLPTKNGVNRVNIPGNGWRNLNNIEFYEDAAVLQTLQNYAVQGGFDQCCDVALASEYIFSSDCILDVGAGYGRVINYLLNNDYRGSLCALERSSLYCKLLREKFKDKITIYHANIHDFKLERTFDTVLWMWSGISDFAKEEQLAVMNQLKNLVRPEGTLILDTLLYSVKPANAEQAEDQYYVIKANGQTVYGYTPSDAEIETYANQLKFQKIQHLAYQTTTGRQRILHILTK